jgi:hypothetical protein
MVRDRAFGQRIEVYIDFKKISCRSRPLTIPSRREALCMSFHDVLAEIDCGASGIVEYHGDIFGI